MQTFQEAPIRQEPIVAVALALAQVEVVSMEAMVSQVI
jgi:hypothetical protein